MNWANIVLLALAAAVYPTLLAGVILILGRPNPLRLLIGFLIGGMTISIGAGIAIVNALESSGAVNTSHHSTKPIVDIVVGLASLLIAWGVWSGRIRRSSVARRRFHRHRAEKHGSSLTERALSRGSVTMAMIAGLVLNLPGVWYLDALSEIAHAKPPTATALAAILVFNLIMFILVEFPIVAYIVNPDRAAGLVNDLSAWAHSRSRGIGIAVATVVGVWLIVKGIIGLS